MLSPKNTKTTLSPEVLLYEQMSASINSYLFLAVLNLCSTLILFFFLLSSGAANHWYLYGWLAYQSLLSFIWVILYSRYHNDYDPIKKVWSSLIEVPLSTACGLGWGMMWALFLDLDNTANALLLTTSIASIAMLGGATTPLHKEAMLATISTVLLPVFLTSVFSDNPALYWFSLATVVYFLTVYTFSMMLNTMYIGALEQREENSQLLKALSIEKQQVERASAEKTRFLSMASHDLRQPLQAMHLFTSVLGSMLTQSDQKAILGKINDTNRNLSDLLDSLLDISKFDSGIVEVSPEYIELNQLFNGLHEQLSDLADKSGVEIICFHTREKVFADVSLLERVLRNLLTNAIKHMGRSGKVLLGVRREAGRLRIDVIDNGKGIPLEEQERIFDEFYQLNNPERNRTEGIGLGLPIVRRLCSLMGCQVVLCSGVGEGSRFSVYFPVSSWPADHSDFPEDMSVKPVSVLDEPLLNACDNNDHILLLEDDKDVSEALCLLLMRAGYKVSVATDISSATAALETTPDFILSDYQLANGDLGIAAIEHVQAHFGIPVPALLITGNAEPDVLTLLAKSPFGVIHKPVDPVKLLNAISRELR